MWWRWRTGGERADKEGKEGTGWISLCVCFFFNLLFMVLLSTLALFQHHTASYSYTCTCSLTWQLPSSARVFCCTLYRRVAPLEPAERVPCSKAPCQWVLREGRMFTHSLYLPRISQLVWEFQNCSLLVTSHFSYLEATTTRAEWINCVSWISDGIYPFYAPHHFQYAHSHIIFYNYILIVT